MTLALLFTSMGATPSLAADDVIPDPGLKKCINANISAARPADQPITTAELGNLKSPLKCSAAQMSGGPKVLSFEGFGAATNVKQVEVDRGYADLGAAGTLSDLAQLPLLEEIWLIGSGITDASLEGLAGAPSLRFIHIDANPGVTSLLPFQGFTKLVRLAMKDNSVTSLTGLEDSTGLITLEAPNNSITTPAPLAGITTLRTVNLSGNALTNLAGLADAAPSLKILQLSDNPELNGNFDDLARHTLLEELQIAKTGASSLKFLKEMTQLRVLDASTNSISSLEGLIPFAPGKSLNVIGQGVKAEPIYAARSASQAIWDANGTVTLRDGVEFPGLDTLSVGGASIHTPPATVQTTIFRGIWEPFPVARFAFDMNKPVEVGAHWFKGAVEAPVIEVELSETELTKPGTVGQDLPGKAIVVLADTETPEPGFVATRYEIGSVSPEWVSINAAGELVGIPPAPGTYRVQVTAYDALGNAVPRVVGIPVADETFPPVITLEGDLPAGTVGTTYPATTVTATGTDPLTWAATGLPDGLTINPTTGEITGTPTTAGTYPVTVTVTNDHGTATADYTITVSSKTAPGGPEPTQPGGTVPPTPNDKLPDAGSSGVGTTALWAGALLLAGAALATFGILRRRLGEFAPKRQI